MGRGSCQQTQVSRASKPLPIRILAELLMAPPTHRSHDCVTEKSFCMSSRGWARVGGVVSVALPSREPCKELGLGFPSGNLSS